VRYLAVVALTKWGCSTKCFGRGPGPLASWIELGIGTLGGTVDRVPDLVEPRFGQGCSYHPSLFAGLLDA
jgi:hypothetical protein